MAELKCNKLFHPVEIAVYCSIVPPRRDYELQPRVYVVVRPNEFIKLIVKLIKILATVLRIV
jgi:hypothetical protein